MDDFGGKLRQARERRGVSLRQIAATTRISIAALEALERNDISKLPGGIFSRAFVRSYAIEVGLNPDETVREFLERFNQEPAPSASALSVELPDEERDLQERQRKAARIGLGAVAALVVLSTALVLVYRARNAARLAATDHDETQTSAPSTQSTRAPAVQAPSVPPQEPAPAPERTPPAASARGASRSAASPSAASRPAASRPAVLPPAVSPPAVSPPAISPPAATPPPAPPAATQLTLEVAPTADCWVSITVDGTKRLARVMPVGEKQRFVVTKEATVEIGDAGAFAYRINGKPGRPLGETGQVRTLTVTPDTAAQFIR